MCSNGERVAMCVLVCQLIDEVVESGYRRKEEGGFCVGVTSCLSFFR